MRAEKLTFNIEILASHSSCFHLPQILLHAKLCKEKNEQDKTKLSLIMTLIIKTITLIINVINNLGIYLIEKKQ